MHGEFGAGARAVVHAHHDDVADFFAITALHALQVFAKRGLAGFARALVDVVHDAIGETIERAVGVAAIERREIAQDQRGATIGRARTVDDHVDAPHTLSEFTPAMCRADYRQPE